MFEEYGDLLNMADVGAALGIHPATARRLCAAGELPGKRLGRRWYVPRSALVALFDDSEEGNDGD